MSALVTVERTFLSPGQENSPKCGMAANIPANTSIPKMCSLLSCECAESALQLWCSCAVDVLQICSGSVADMLLMCCRYGVAVL